MKQVTFAVPGDLATATGGFVYDRRIIAELPKHGWQADVLDLGESFPRPPPSERATAHLQLAALSPSRVIVIDGLAFGVLPEAAEALHRTHRLVALVHHPLALETGLPEREVSKLRASERLALSFARRVITTSATTARLLQRTFAVPQDSLSVVVPGNDPCPVDERPRDGIVNLLAVGSIIHRKGYDILIEALGKIVDLPWKLIIVGDRSRSPATAQALDAQIARLRLGDRVTLMGVVPAEQMTPLYAACDLFVLPSRYEGYGMAFSEAIAHGRPVVGTTAGAIPEAVPQEAGELVPPDNVPELTLALMRLIGNPVARARLAASARACAAKLPTWADAGRQFAQALDAVA